MKVLLLCIILVMAATFQITELVSEPVISQLASSFEKVSGVTFPFTAISELRIAVLSLTANYSFEILNCQYYCNMRNNTLRTVFRGKDETYISEINIQFVKNNTVYSNFTYKELNMSIHYGINYLWQLQGDFYYCPSEAGNYWPLKVDPNTQAIYVTFFDKCLRPNEIVTEFKFSPGPMPCSRPAISKCKDQCPSE